MGASGGPNVVLDGLIHSYDVSDKVSYSGSLQGQIIKTINDLVGSSNGSVASSPTFDTGSLGTDFSIVMDGSDDNIDIGDIGDVFGTSFAVVMWFNTNDVDNRQEYIGQYQNSNNWWRWGNDEIDNWEIDVQDSGTRTVSVNPDWTVVANQWVHTACSRNGATWNFYKNGEIDGSGSDDSTVPDIAANVKLGSATGEEFGGKLASVQIYNRYLTTAEIRQNYNAFKRRFGL